MAIHKQSALLAGYGSLILKGESDSVRMASQEIFKRKMDSLILLPASFDYSFGEVKNLSVLFSSDKKVKVYSWMMPTGNGMRFDYFGYVQVKNPVSKTIKIYQLKEKKYENNAAAEYIKTADTAWYGALYYKLVTKKYNDKEQYVLLGWKGKDVFTTRKVIDVLSVSPSKIEFGKPVFKASGKAKSRVILEYNAQANVSMNYNKSMDMIVLDHLSSSDPRPESKNMYSLYGPDMSYDGYLFKEGMWYLQQNIKVTNKKEEAVKEVKMRRDLRMQRKDE